MNAEKKYKLISLVPNGLTLGRLVLTVIFLVMVLYAPRQVQEGRADFLLTAFIIFVVAGLTDIIDGKVARAFNVASKFGRIVDPLADKILVCGAFICFAIIGEPRLDNFNIAPTVLATIHWAVAIILIGREILVTVLRQLAEARGISFAATASGKLKMFLQSFAIGTVIIKWAYVTRIWGDWFVIVTFLLMVASTVISGFRSLNRPRA
jgi:CDP-diacylglycerol---glycerol-3-phosphate 3-phosphatidyltransferase